MIRPRATIAVYANNGGDEVTLKVRETFSLNVRFQFVLLYTVGDRALAAAAEDVTERSGPAPWTSARSTACPSTTSRSSGPPTRTRPSRTRTVGKVLIDVSEG